MIAVTVVFLLFVIMGGIFLAGKGGFLIAGYNTADKKDKQKYDEKKLNRCFAIFCFGVAIAIAATAYVDTDEFALKVSLPVILLLLAFIFIASNTYCKRK